MKNPDAFPDPNRLLEELSRRENAAGMPAFDVGAREDVRVRLRVDESVSPGMFRADPLVPGGYVANSLTLRAVRPDIFVAGGDLDEFTAEAPCPGCGRGLDRQFWRLCPHCARDLSRA